MHFFAYSLLAVLVTHHHINDSPGRHAAVTGLVDSRGGCCNEFKCDVSRGLRDSTQIECLIELPCNVAWTDTHIERLYVIELPHAYGIW